MQENRYLDHGWKLPPRAAVEVRQCRGREPRMPEPMLEKSANTGRERCAQRPVLHDERTGQGRQSRSDGQLPENCCDRSRTFRTRPPLRFFLRVGVPLPAPREPEAIQKHKRSRAGAALRSVDRWGNEVRVLLRVWRRQSCRCNTASEPTCGYGCGYRTESEKKKPKLFRGLGLLTWRP